VIAMLDIAMIERGLEKSGKTKGGLARAMGVRPGAVSEILAGLRLIKASEIAPIMEYLELNSVPIMGRVGAGDSMLPKYANGDIIVVYREQRHPLASFFGEEAAVRLKTGERYLKTIERGKSASVVNLTSFNAKPINGVKLEWIGEICVSLPRAQIQRMRTKSGTRARKGTKPASRPDEK
jgi:repressor LexA